MRQYPPGFLSLSASVACERFGFFLLASLLLLYPSQRLGFTTAQATGDPWNFVAATHVSPLLVGFLTDGRLGAVYGIHRLPCRCGRLRAAALQRVAGRCFSDSGSLPSGPERPRPRHRRFCDEVARRHARAA